MRRLPAVLVLVLAGCSSVDQAPPDVFSGDPPIRDWAEWDAYKNRVADLRTEPADPQDMKDALTMLERMARSRPDDAEIAIQATETALWLSDRAETTESRKHYAEKAVRSGREAVKATGGWFPARAYYRLALAIGYYVREDRGLGMIPEMEEAAKAAVEHDEGFENAAPHRFLALLYAQAPSFPMSIGDLEAAKEHAERALELYPDEPENHIVMAEVLIEDGDGEGAKAELEKALELLGEDSSDDAARHRAKVQELLGEVG